MVKLEPPSKHVRRFQNLAEPSPIVYSLRLLEAEVPDLFF